MHDSVIASSILRDLGKQGHVEEAEIEVGELFGIEPEHLLEHLQEVSDIKFKVRQAASRVKCGCGFTGRPRITERLHDIVLYECPVCQGQPEVLHGDKIIIKRIKCA